MPRGWNNNNYYYYNWNHNHNSKYDFISSNHDKEGNNNFLSEVCEDIQYNVNEENIETSATSNSAISKNALGGSGAVYFPTTSDMVDKVAEWSIELKPNDGSIYIVQTTFEVAGVDYILYKFSAPGIPETTSQSVCIRNISNIIVWK